MPTAKGSLKGLSDSIITFITHQGNCIRGREENAIGIRANRSGQSSDYDRVVAQDQVDQNPSQVTTV
jgi:hypothetical protein